MNELLVFCFSGEHEADMVRTELLKLRHDHLVDLEDAIVATRDKEGNIKLRVIHHFSTSGIVGGGMGTILGLIIGSILVDPLFEYVLHEAGTKISKKMLTEIGIGEDFIKELASEMKRCCSSALFVLALKSDPDKILADLRPFKGHVLRATLSQDEATIKAALASVK